MLTHSQIFTFIYKWPNVKIPNVVGEMSTYRCRDGDRRNRLLRAIIFQNYAIILIFVVWVGNESVLHLSFVPSLFFPMTFACKTLRYSGVNL